MASSSSSFSSPSWLDPNQESPHLSNIALNRITGLGVLNHQEKCRCLCLSFSECVRLTPLQRATSKANGRGLFHIAISTISLSLYPLSLSDGSTKLSLRSSKKFSASAKIRDSSLRISISFVPYILSLSAF